MNPQTAHPAPNEPAAVLPWDLVAAFLSVMRTGSLSAASRSLSVAQPTVRRQIEKLEEVLGGTLFTRSQAGLAPTETALAALPYAQSMSGIADALVRSVSARSTADAGTVRITCSELMGVEVLPAMISSLRQLYPLLRIELSLTNANEDLLRREADIAVRLAPPSQSALVAKRVATLELGLFASEGYLKAHGVPKGLGDLPRGHALIGRDRDTNFYALVAAMGIPIKRQGFALRTDSDAAQISAIRAGVGIGVCQVPLASKQPSLVRVLSKVRMDLPVWIVTHEDLRASRRVAIVFEHLASALSAYASAAPLRRKRA